MSEAGEQADQAGRDRQIAAENEEDHGEFCSCTDCRSARDVRRIGAAAEAARHEAATCTCDQMDGGKLCATCASGATDPGLVPFEDLPEETRLALKPGQCIVWDAERGCYVPVPIPVQEAAGGASLKPLKSPWLGEEEVIPELRPEDRLHTATDGEKQPFLTSDEIRCRLERLEHPQVAVIAEEEAALRVRRDLQERAFLVLLGDEDGGTRWPDHPQERRRYFINLWRLAVEAVGARP